MRITNKMSILFCLLFITFSIFSCASRIDESAVWSDRTGKDYNDKDREFILSFTAHVSDIFAVADDENVDIEEKLKRVKQFEKFIDENDKVFTFSWGTVFSKDSSLSLILHAAYTRIYRDTDQCDKILWHIYQFQRIAAKDYLIIDGSSRAVYDPVTDQTVYREEKKEDFQRLFDAMGQPECIKCDMVPNPNWVPASKCLDISSKSY